MSTVFAMVKQVLADSKEKLAAQQNNSISGRANGTQPKEKQAAAKPAPAPSGGRPEAEKVAAALDYVADNLGLLVDTRSPQEKLAEYAAISEAMAKAAEEHEGKGPHQTQEAPGSFQPPMNPSLAGPQAGAGDNQLQNYEAEGGAPVLEPGESGEAPSDVQPPMGTEPGESAFPGDEASNALDTNASAAPGGSGEAPEKIARARAVKLAGMVASGQITEKTAAAIIARDKVKVAHVRKVQAAKAKTAAAKPKMAPKGKPMPPKAGAKKPMTKKAALEAKAAQSGLPVKTARALINKLAEDAINPASISAGTTPGLQTAQGANPAQMQGTPAGEGVPDTKGSDQGREGISSITSAINATKNELKGQRTRAEMREYLNTPALDSGSDSVLQQSLENASSAGVKIAATKAMLQKWASGSPERQERLQSAISKVKKANEMMGYGAGAGAGAPPALPMGGGDMGGGGGGAGMAPPMTAAMPGAGGGAKQAMGEPGVEPVSDAALAAAAQGVDPEELTRAEAILEEQMGMAGGMGEEGMMPPEMMGGEMGGEEMPPAEEMPAEEPPPAEEEEVPAPPQA